MRSESQDTMPAPDVVVQDVRDALEGSHRSGTVDVEVEYLLMMLGHE